MAVYSDSFKNAYKTSAKTKLVGVFETPPARTLTAEMKVWTGEYVNDTAAAIAIGEEIFLGRLPKNATIRQAYFVHQTGAGVDVAGNGDLGLFNLDETPKATGDEILSAVGNRATEYVDLVLDQDYNIAFEPAVAVAVGNKIRVVIYYTEM